MKIIFVRNKNVSPAGYYRICQYLNDSDDVIISQYSVNRYYKSRLPKYIKMAIYGFIPGYARRIAVISKALMSNEEITLFIQRRVFVKKVFYLDRLLLKKLLKVSRRIVWDFDDNIFSNGEITDFETRLLLKYATDIVIPNGFLADKISNSNGKIHFIPTTDSIYESIELELINSRREETYDKEIRMLWLGTHSNIKYLNKILPYLDKAAVNLKKKNIKLVLRNVSDAKVHLNNPSLIIENVSWTREVANQEILSSHIGLMPLELNDYTPGKAAFKAVQYMSAGIPTILSPVGYNKEVIDHKKNGFFASTENEWIQYIIQLSTDYNYWLEISRKSRENWEIKFNSKEIKLFYRELLEIS